MNSNERPRQPGHLDNSPWSDGGALFWPPSKPNQRPVDRPSYASATMTATVTSNNRPLPSIHPTEIDRTHRTHILRRLEPNTTPTDIIRQMTDQLEIPAPDLFEAVLRDPKDRRRFYVTYRTAHLKQHALGKGFTIGNISIKPQDDTLHGYIPFPPYYVDFTTMDNLITEHGELVSSSFVETPHHVRVAGYKFQLRLKKGVVRPLNVTYNGYTMEIHYQDDERKCTYCHKIGHLQAICRSRLAAQAERKAQKEAHFDDLKITWEQDIRKITDQTYEEVTEVKRTYLCQIQLATDIYEEDLDLLTKSNATPATLGLWYDTFETYTTPLTTEMDDQMVQILADNLESKKYLTDIFTKAGGRPPSEATAAMEVGDLNLDNPDISDYLADGDEIADCRQNMNRLFHELKSKAPPTDPAAEAGNLPSATPPTDEKVEPMLQDTTTDAVVPAKPPPPPASTTVTTPAAKPQAQDFTEPEAAAMDDTSSTGPDLLQLPLEIKHFGTEIRKFYLTHSNQLPEDFSAAHCPYIISFKTKKHSCHTLLLRKLLEICSKEPKYNLINPAAILFYRASDDVDHHYIHVRDADANRLLVQILEKSNTKKQIPLTSEITQLENDNYETESSDDGH